MPLLDLPTLSFQALFFAEVLFLALPLLFLLALSLLLDLVCEDLCLKPLALLLPFGSTPVQVEQI